VQIENSFVVTAPPPQVWDLLLDVERVAPCMPGAELTEVVDDKTWKGRVKMRIGPVSMTYSGTVVMVERDDAGRSVTLRAEGRETSGKGNAAATVRSTVQPAADGGSRVLIHQDLQLSGMAAQFGGRMMQDVSAHLTQQFADRLSAQLTADPGQPAAAAPPTELPALRLAIWAFLRAIARVLHLPSSRRDSAAAAQRPGSGR
jgi:uncharacterized protein